MKFTPPPRRLRHSRAVATTVSTTVSTISIRATTMLTAGLFILIVWSAMQVILRDTAAWPGPAPMGVAAVQPAAQRQADQDQEGQDQTEHLPLPKKLPSLAAPVWYQAHGQVYHWNEHCPLAHIGSHRKIPRRYATREMAQAHGLKPCPICSEARSNPLQDALMPPLNPD